MLKMSVKQSSVLILSALLVIGVVFAGCVENPEKPTEKEKPVGTKTPEAQKKEVKKSKEKTSKVGAGKVTLKEAFAYLKKECGMSDLKFMSYDTGSMDEQGRADSYLIAGYSPGEDIGCYVSSFNGLMDKIRKHKPDQEVIYYDIKEIKDSPELISEAIAKRGTCAENSFMFRIVPAKNKPAEVLCASSKWAVEIDFIK